MNLIGIFDVEIDTDIVKVAVLYYLDVVALAYAGANHLVCFVM